MYIDSHTHLNSPELWKRRFKLLDDFQKQGGRGLINIWTDEKDNKRAVQLASQADIDILTKACIGYHPSQVVFGQISEDQIDNKIQKLKDLYNQNTESIVGIWETGIDMHYDGNDKLSVQKKLLDRHCQLASKLDIPVVIHSRDNFADTKKILQKYNNLKIYFHCRGYDKAKVKDIQNTFEDVWIGFCGNLTYKSADNLHQSLEAIDLDSLVLETDAPYLTPQPRRGRQNRPSYVVYLYRFVADKLWIGMENLQEKIKNNFENLYSVNL